MNHDFGGGFFTTSARKVSNSAKNANKCLKSPQKFRQISKRGDFIVLELISAHAKRVGVSGMQDFFPKQFFTQNLQVVGNKLKLVKIFLGRVLVRDL